MATPRAIAAMGLPTSGYWPRAVVTGRDDSGDRELTYAAIAIMSCKLRFATTGFMSFTPGAGETAEATTMSKVAGGRWQKRKIDS